MRLLYSIQTAALTANPPPANYHALRCPGAPQFSLVVVENWNSDAQQDAWEDLPSVTAHHIERLGDTVPAALVAAFGVPPYNVGLTDTLREAFRKIRRAWPACRL